MGRHAKYKKTTSNKLGHAIILEIFLFWPRLFMCVQRLVIGPGGLGYQFDEVHDKGSNL